MQIFRKAIVTFVHRIIISPNIFLHNMSSQKPKIANFAFFDIETTGLPSMENNQTKIIEMSVVVIESEHIALGVYPRVQNKLSLCLNPRRNVDPVATKITGLANSLLENQTPFTNDVGKALNDFLLLQKQPLSLVAHNGNWFDYPILRAELESCQSTLPHDILCIDSLLCFRQLHMKQEQSAKSKNDLNREEIFSHDHIEFHDGYDELLCKAVDEYEASTSKQNIQKLNETTPQKQLIRRPVLERQIPRVNRPSFKLEDVFKRLTGRDPENSHQAEGDVQALIQCAAVYGEEFVTWANENARLLCDIKPMMVGRRM